MNAITDETRAEMAQLVVLLSKHKDRIAVVDANGGECAVKSVSNYFELAGAIIECEMAGGMNGMALTLLRTGNRRPSNEDR